MVAMRSFGFTLGVLALAAAAFVLGTHAATRGPGGPPGASARAARWRIRIRSRERRRSCRCCARSSFRSRRGGGGLSRERRGRRAARPGDRAAGRGWAALDPAGALDRVGSWPAAAESGGTEGAAATRGRGAIAPRRWNGPAGARDDGTAPRPYSPAGRNRAIRRCGTSSPPRCSRAWSASSLRSPDAAGRGARGIRGLLARVDALPDDRPDGFKSAAIGTAIVLVADHDPARAAASSIGRSGPVRAGTLAEGHDSLGHARRPERWTI